MPLRLYNTLSRRVEPFQPLHPGEARVYVCGITPYDVSHVGHARCYVVFDVVRRVLRANGYKVRYVQNFTDVDDKIIARAKESGVSTGELVQKNIEDFFTKMDALGIERADVYPKVTDHIPDIVALIQKLIERKAAYALPDGDVYFSVKADSDYGKLSKRPLEELLSGARVEVNAQKHNPLDFALWKSAKPEDPPEVIWKAPWGRGRPGWHIECSVMAMKHLGSPFDIHGGGLDLIFPHHENEIAQSETATGLPFVHLWMHNGFVTLNKEKMSKSLGNFFTLSDIFATYHPSVVRYMLLTVHYRSPLDFSSELLDQSRSALAGLKDAIARATRVLKKQTLGMDDTETVDAKVAAVVEGFVKECQAVLSEDFNTPEALGQLHRMVGFLEKQFSSNTVSRAGIRSILEGIQQASRMLGLDLFPSTRDLFIAPELTELAQRRDQARQAKNWKEADRLRKEILDRGYVVEDTPQGPRLLPKAS